MIGKAFEHLFDSKTYVLLILFTLLGLLAVILADAAFHRDLWGRFFDELLGNSVVGGGRAAVVDGAPKIAAAWQNPNSQAANPPPAVSTPQPSPPPVSAGLGLYVPKP